MGRDVEKILEVQTVEFMEIFKAIILGVVQGITEWLPVSSTGHLILVEEFIRFNLSDIFRSTFMVVIQLGSILAVLVLYFKKLNPFDSGKTDHQRKETFSLWVKILVASIPAAVIGLLYDDAIDRLFYNPTTVSITLIVYGVIFILLENRKKIPRVSEFADLSYVLALFIGVFQMLALIPGTSRSGATIVGAVLMGCSRTVAAEFSFFLALPVMLGASALKLLKAGFGFNGLEWTVLGVGSLVAFLVSLFAIKFLMSYIQRHDFKAFGYYRIVLGLIVLAYFYLLH